MRHSILIAENDFLGRLTITNMLEVTGCRVIDAHTQETALGMLEGIWFDVILLPSTKGDPDGRNFARKAKAIQPHIKTILMTGFGHHEYMPPHVDAIAMKPFSLDDIIFAIRIILNDSSKAAPT